MGEELFPLKSGGFVKLSPRETSLCGNCHFKPGGRGTDCIRKRTLFADNEDRSCGEGIFKFVAVKPSEEELVGGGEYLLVPGTGCGSCCFRTDEGGGCAKPSHFPSCTLKQFRKGPNYSEPSSVKPMTSAKPLDPSESDYVKVPCSSCEGCVFRTPLCNKPTSFSSCNSAGNSGTSMIFKHKSDYIIVPEPKPEPKPVIEPETMTKAILERDYVKVPGDDCVGCFFRKMSNGLCTIGGLYIRSCGAGDNGGISMQYRLRTTPEPKSIDSIEPSSTYRIGSEITLENGDMVTVRAEHDHNSCEGCCFNSDDCRKDKYNFDFQCHGSGIIFTGDLTVEAEEEEDPENLDYEYHLDDGGVVQAIRPKEKDSCTGCYFNDVCEGCTKARLLSECPNCDGIIFDLIEDPPLVQVEDEDDDDESSEGNTPKVGTVLRTLNNEEVIVCENSFMCSGCYFNEPAGDCSINKKFSRRRGCHNVIYKLVGSEDNEIEEEEEVLEESIEPSVGQFFDTKGGVTVVTCSDGGECCKGCYFVHPTDGCSQIKEIGREVYCSGIIFKTKIDELLPFDPGENKIDIGLPEVAKPKVDLTFRKEARLEL